MPETPTYTNQTHLAILMSNNCGTITEKQKIMNFAKDMPTFKSQEHDIFLNKLSGYLNAYGLNVTSNQKNGIGFKIGDTNYYMVMYTPDDEKSLENNVGYLIGNGKEDLQQCNDAIEVLDRIESIIAKIKNN